MADAYWLLIPMAIGGAASGGLLVSIVAGAYMASSAKRKGIVTDEMPLKGIEDVQMSDSYMKKLEFYRRHNWFAGKWVKMAQKAIDLNPGNMKARKTLAWVYLEKGDIQASMSEIDQALSIDSGNLEIIQLRERIGKLQLDQETSF